MITPVCSICLYWMMSMCIYKKAQAIWQCCLWHIWDHASIFHSTYPYSNKERPFKKNAGQVSDDRSPVKLMTVLINSLNWPVVPGSACLTDMASTSFTEGDLSPLSSEEELLRLLEKKDLPIVNRKEKWKEDKEEKITHTCTFWNALCCTTRSSAFIHSLTLKYK